MKHGASRFDFYLDQLSALFAKAAKQKNPALWLYRNNARTPLFMLEALSRLYADLHNRKKFEKAKDHFKALEDALGVIDYYDNMAKQMATKNTVPGNLVKYLEAVTREKVQRLNELLEEKKWIDEDEDRVGDIRKSIYKADWLKPKEELKAIKDFYGAAIYDIKEFVTERNFHFENVENDVHELRRRLRWLSIYPQALRGCIQLTQTNKTAPHLKKYLTKEIVTSPFNKMPDKGDNEAVLLLEQDFFYALSWMIAELGKLKDEGLNVIALVEALQQGREMTEETSYSEAYRFLGAGQPTLGKLLKQAEKISAVYFKEQNLEYLVKGITRK